ncbi:glycosyltransferase family 2 protein [Nitrosovibrio sp. Nv17]|uniref:glycosyltransferase family 2 protein n=1 Tax=Nitrosovibrio sp. Nv17 TaxID=1855339 RepID=UPI000908C32F|nr:glycosyltransferase family 2 protein [Nitrosovibrio sp. Nv17]SFW16361.1 Glycosyl transferase family 2 [Nitrosovibrio sp. Nv17]
MSDEMNMPMTLSVALATYNGERYLAEQLDSIARQTRLPDELVVSDDASADSTRDIVADFIRHAPFPVRLLVNAERLGSTRNFERAIRACAGDAIFLCDQDDVWYPSKAALIERRFMDDPGTVLVFTDADVVDRNLNPLALRLWEAMRFRQPERMQIEAGDAFSVLLRRYLVTGATLAFRSRYRDLLLPIPEVWVHDAWIAMLLGGVSRLAALSTPLIAYRVHDANQIGLPRRGMNRGKTCAMVHGPQVLRYERILARLREFQDRYPESGDNLCRLEGTLAFLRKVAVLPDARWRRLPGALRILASKDYHRYARGFRSFRQDLLR